MLSFMLQISLSRLWICFSYAFAWAARFLSFSLNSWIAYIAKGLNNVRETNQNYLMRHSPIKWPSGFPPYVRAGAGFYRFHK
jgi:hypothetical protein